MPSFHQRTEELKTTLVRARDSKLVKTTLAIMALGVGAYFGTKASLSQIAGDVKDIKENTRLTSSDVAMTNLILDAEIVERQVVQDNQRDAITQLIKDGKSFTHYPGVGVLDHSIYEQARKK